MKLAWLCYEYDFADDSEDLRPEPKIVFSEPDYGMYAKVVPIVYAEIVQ